LRLIQESRSRTTASVDPFNPFHLFQYKERTMPQRRSSGESRRKSSAAKQHSHQPNQSKQMGQSSGAKPQQVGSGSSRQSGSGSTSMKRQQTAQDLGKTQDEASAAGVRGHSTRRSDDLEGDEDVERAGLTRDDDSDIESR
jgi:hypothetical protein